MPFAVLNSLDNLVRCIVIRRQAAGESASAGGRVPQVSGAAEGSLNGDRIFIGAEEKAIAPRVTVAASGQRELYGVRHAR